MINEMCKIDSWPNVRYHFVIYLYFNSLMTILTKTIILGIKDQSNYQIKGKINIENRNKMKGRTKYYFRNHKIQCIGNIKPEYHVKSKVKKMKAMNMIVYKMSIKIQTTKNIRSKNHIPLP